MTLMARTFDDGRSRLVAYDHGAHLASWEADGHPVLWLSELAVLDGSAPIRGGVPLCFPWFASGPQGRHSPSHGVVRTAGWRPVPTEGEEIWAWQVCDDDVVSAAGADQVPGPFRLRHAVGLSPDGPHRTLVMELAIHNPGARAYRVEAALHTYLAVGDVVRTRVRGLSGADVLDKVTGRRGRHEGDLRVNGETDLVVDRAGTVVVEDPAGGRRLELTSTGAATQTVVWNPGPEQAAALSDVATGAWRRFVCVETAATAGQDLQVPAGGTVTLGCVLSTRPVSAI